MAWLGVGVIEYHINKKLQFFCSCKCKATKNLLIVYVKSIRSGNEITQANKQC